MTVAPPKLQLPDPPKERRGGSGTLIVLQLVLLVVLILNIFISHDRRVIEPLVTNEPSLTGDELKRLAVRFESLNLHDAAAQRWLDYLDVARPGRIEAGNTRLKIGKLYQQAGQYGKALSEYITAETLLAGSANNRKREIDLSVAECLKRLGKYPELAREIAARSMDDPESAALAGQQVVAEIGPDKITVAQFDALLADEIDQAVNSRMGISEDEKEAMRRRAHQQFGDPAARAQQLQQIVATRVLADDARKENLNESKAFRDRLVSVADHILAETHLSQEVSQRATLTDEDVQNYYAANKDRYTEPASTFIAHIQCDSEDEARALLDRISGGESFDSLVKEASKDEATRDKLGILTTPVHEDSDTIPIFGVNPDLQKHIQSAEAGAVLPDPIKSDRGWHIVKVVSHRDAKEHPFDEVADQVRRDAKLARERAVTEQYLTDLFKRCEVKLYPEVFYGEDKTAKDDAEHMQ